MMKLLFIGDSITDAGRDYANTTDIGNGYVSLIHGMVCTESGAYEILNRGVSGNTVENLRLRWERDCLAIHPDHLTLLIGINDCWRRYDSGNVTSEASFEANVRYLVTSYGETHSACNVIIMEPFLIPVRSAQHEWFEDLGPKQRILRSIAADYDVNFIELQKVFDRLSHAYPPGYFSIDGVHPTAEGAKVIANRWLEVFNLTHQNLLPK